MNGISSLNRHGSSKRPRKNHLASLKRNNKKQWVAQVRSKDPKQALQRKGLRGMRIEPKK